MFRHVFHLYVELVITINLAILNYLDLFPKVFNIFLSVSDCYFDWFVVWDNQHDAYVEEVCLWNQLKHEDFIQNTFEFICFLCRSDNSINYSVSRLLLFFLQFVFLVWNNINEHWIFSASYDSFFLKNCHSSLKDNYFYMDCFERNSMSASLFIFLFFLILLCKT